MTHDTAVMILSIFGFVAGWSLMEFIKWGWEKHKKRQETPKDIAKSYAECKDLDEQARMLEQSRNFLKRPPNV